MHNQIWNHVTQMNKSFLCFLWGCPSSCAKLASEKTTFQWADYLPRYHVISIAIYNFDLFHPAQTMCKTRFGSQGVILDVFKQNHFSKYVNGTRDPLTFMPISISVFGTLPLASLSVDFFVNWSVPKNDDVFKGISLINFFSWHLDDLMTHNLVQN